MIPNILTAAIDAIVPDGVTHIGFVPTDIDGKVLVNILKKSAHKVTATFSKKRLLPGEMASRTLVGCMPILWVSPRIASILCTTRG